MYKNFEKLAQANLDHYNSNPGTHMAMATGILVVGVVAINFVARRGAKNNRMCRAGRYAK